MITSSLDWADRRETLQLQIQSLAYNPDLRKMLSNIDTLVRDLSKAEVNARRNHKNTIDLPELKKVNDSIEVLEKWIMMGALLG